MDVAHEKCPRWQRLQRRRERAGIKPARAAFGAGEAFDDALAVRVGLEPADEPRARVREGLVIEVHRVLRREDDAHAEGARLLEQGEQRALRRWVERVGW